MKAYGIGIDHGTTNSAVAVMTDSGPQIIKPTPTDNTMPSVVYIDKDGIEYVGKEARDALIQLKPEEGDGAHTYKPHIGQNKIYSFPKCGTEKTAVQLGGMVIGKLLGLCEPRIGGRPTQVVITVPAMFSAAGTERTREASQLAGLKKYPQVMEPVAAAIAYGFDKTDERAQWMIFDLGGGTLDISLVTVREGELRVNAHAGDTDLGGNYFDDVLFDYVVDELSRIYSYSLESLKHPPKYSDFEWAQNLLKAICEDAKIELSKRQEVKIERDTELCKDDNGKLVKDFEITVTREKYEELIANLVERAVHFCETLLKQKNLSAKDIDRLILVGGPTKTPYIKQQLSRCGIQLEDSINPMTVVARGAAIYAAWLPLPPNSDDEKPQQQQGEMHIKIASTSTSAASEIIPVRGKVTDKDGNPVTDSGFTVKIERTTDDGWASGSVPLDKRGKFKVNVPLINKGKSTLSAFKTTLLDSQGQVRAEINQPEIWYPAQLPENQLANSIRVETPRGGTTVLAKAGKALPTKGRGQFQTTKALQLMKVLKHEFEDDAWRIPVRESVRNLLGAEEDHKDASLLIGVLIIKASEVIDRMKDGGMSIRDLPEETEVEITVEVDHSRNIKVTAYLPELAEDFPTTFKAGAYDVSYQDVIDSFDNLKAEWQLIRELQDKKPDAGVAEVLALIERLHAFEDIEKALANAATESDDAESQKLRAYKRIVELTGTILHIKGLQQAKRIEQHLKQLRNVWIADDGKKMLKKIDEEFKEYQQAGKDDQVALGKIEDELHDVDNYVRAGPFFLLCGNDIPAIILEDRSVTSEQRALFDKSNALCQEVMNRGDPKTDAGVQRIINSLTETEIKELSEMHKQLSEAFAATLPQWLKDLDEDRNRRRKDTKGTTVKTKR